MQNVDGHHRIHDAPRKAPIQTELGEGRNLIYGLRRACARQSARRLPTCCLAVHERLRSFSPSWEAMPLARRASADLWGRLGQRVPQLET